jgi:hypothetical protein
VEAGILTSIENKSSEIKRFEEINAKFNTFKHPPGPGEVHTLKKLLRRCYCEPFFGEAVPQTRWVSIHSLEEHQAVTRPA